MAKERRVRILTDTNPMDPRQGFDAGRMVCWHRRYNLGDEHNYDCDDFMRELAFEADSDCEDEVDRLENEVWNELYNETGSQYDATQAVNETINGLIESAVRAGYVILPIYLYDHSGVTISTGPWQCIFDSGQVGYIICDNETIDREFNGDRQLAQKCLKAEVSTYDDYLTGNVYGFIVEETDETDEDGEPVWDDAEELDSCWGFFGSDVRTNGMAEHLGSDELIDLAEDAEIEYP